MRQRARLRRTVLFTTAALLLAIAAVKLGPRIWATPDVTFITGAVLRNDADRHKQRPVPNVRITASSGVGDGETTSDAAGFFSLRLRPALAPGTTIRLTFRHPDYYFLATTGQASDEMLVVRLQPAGGSGGGEQPKVAISNVRLRYALRSTEIVEVGSTARLFDINNTANIPCKGRQPCSPDGKWKATIGYNSLDSGPDQQFRNARVSCIAGPCPFSRIEGDEYLNGGRVIRVAVRSWSDPVTYLVEADVARVVNSEVIRHSYPVIFGRSMDFTLPPPAQGPSIEAEVNGDPIVFPLGPALKLSWAVCKMETGADRTRLYRCELNPQYEFRQRPGG